MASELAEVLLRLHQGPRLQSFVAEGTWHFNVMAVEPLTEADLQERKAVDDVREAMTKNGGLLSPPVDRFVPTGPPPEDEEDALIDIGIACINVFAVSDDGESMPHVQGGENLGAVSLDARQRFGTSEGVEGAAVRVDHIVFLGSDEARAELSISHAGTEWPQIARVIRIDDSWKVDRELIANLYGMVGIVLPPPPD